MNMDQSKKIMYHGTCHLFDRFEIDRLGTGEGKSKFGHGIYITPSYATAAEYAAKAAKKNNVEDYYVYTVEVPKLVEGNHIFSSIPVNPEIVARIEAAIGEPVPDQAKTMGKMFRKYVGNLRAGKKKSQDNPKGMTEKKMMSTAEFDAENAAAKLFDENGITFLVWPYHQVKSEILLKNLKEHGPEGVDTDRAVLNAENVRIIQVDSVKTDEKNNFIEDSAKPVKVFFG